jgi:lipoate-protein ligase B
VTPFDVLDLGRMSYENALCVQLDLQAKVLSEERPDTLILVEHDPVLTLGASFHAENLLHPMEHYKSLGIQVTPTDRGGDVTYHGPGQLVGYPIFDLRRHGQDLHRWLRDIEEAILLAAGDFGVSGRRFPPHTGVWVGDEKVCAIGVKVKRWVSIHGFALNCELDLGPFGEIVPCGIRGYGVTSLSHAANRPVAIDEAKGPVIRSFIQVFGFSEPHHA